MVFQSEKQDSGSMSEKNIRKIYTVAEIEAQTLSGSEKTSKSKFEFVRTMKTRGLFCSIWLEI